MSYSFSVFEGEEYYKEKYKNILTIKYTDKKPKEIKYSDYETIDDPDDIIKWLNNLFNNPPSKVDIFFGIINIKKVKFNGI